MKKSLLHLTTASLFCFGAVTAISQNSEAFTSPSTKSDNSQLIVAKKTVALMSGTFVAAEAPTTGTAKIVEEDGQMYLHIDSAFSTNEQAPDLQILLDTVNEPPGTYQEEETTRYLNLGGIQSFTGEQRYPIPDFVDPSQFKSVVVWCRMANATMGYASLSEDDMASIE